MNTATEERIAHVFKIPALRPKQAEALRSVVAGKDTIVNLPTGSGKSLCFEALSTVSENKEMIVVVVSSLSSLLKTETEKLNSHGISAVYIGDKTSYDIEDVQQGKFSYVLGNPEQFLGERNISGVLRSQLYKDRVKVIAFDEVHTAVSWGLSCDSKPAFRAYFSQVGDLRAIFPRATMMCLTATASKSTTAKIKELFVLRDPVVIAESPDRRNIRVGMYKVKALECFKWLFYLLSMSPSTCPRAIIYCRRRKDCSLVFQEFVSRFGKVPDNLSLRMFDMVHSKTPKDVMSFITSELISAESNLKVVIATKVLGMGLDMKCDLVVHYGPPGTIDEYIQQIGRAGRSSSVQAHAILLYHGRQLRNVDSKMMQLLKSEGDCLRKMALSDFGEVSDVHFDFQHLCCTVCTNICECGQCETGKNPFELFSPSVQCAGDDQEADNFMQRVVSDEHRNLVTNELFHLKESLDRDVLAVSHTYTGPESVHGLSVACIHCILEELPSLYSVDDIINTCHVSNYETVCRITTVLSNVFGDLDNDFSIDEDDLTNM